MGESIKIPWHLWTVGGVSLLWNGFGAFDFTATVTRFEPYMGSFPPEMIEFWNSYPIWLFLIWGLAVWGGTLGSLLILLRKRVAEPVLGVSFAAATVSMIIGYLRPGPEGSSNPVLSIIILGISGLLFGYARWLNGRRLLR